MRTPLRWHFVVAAAGCGAALLARRRRIVDLLLLPFGCYLAFAHVRNIALLGMLLHVPLSRTLASLPRSAHTRAVRTAALPLLALALAWAIFPARGYWGYGIPPTRVPTALAASIGATFPTANVMNFYHYGGYLGWELGPRYGIMVDGRHFEVDRSLEVHDAVLRADPSWRELLDRYRIDVIVIPVTLPFSGKLVPLVPRLLDAPEWKLVGVDPAAVMFARRAAPLDAVPEERLWDHALAELELTAEENPSASHAAESLFIVRARRAASRHQP